jgi:hypothetical protein
MNRLSPLIVRRVGPFAPALHFDWPLVTPEQQTLILDDLKMLATAWLGGLIFFGTFFA